MDWDTLGPDWPNTAASRRVLARPHRWHVQILGPSQGPVLLLLHGTGGASHSWRDLAPRLAEGWRVVAPDLPGHGFTKLGALQRSSPRLMAEDLAHLLDKLELRPDAVLGHSAGAALALVLAERWPEPLPLVGINPALDNFKGAAGWLFPMMAKALALNPFVAPTVARLASAEGTRRLIEGTGSKIDAVGLACYRACLADSAHVNGALTMMSQWRFEPVQTALERRRAPTLFVTGAKDKTVPPEIAEGAAARMAQAQVVRLEGLGHLAHEEAPDRVAAQILSWLGRQGNGATGQDTAQAAR